MFAFTVRQLEIFCEVSRSKSLRDAADRLNITQPAVSAHMRSLEDQLGRCLFKRQAGKPMTLSADGELFLSELTSFLEAGRKLSKRKVPDSSKDLTVRSYVGAHLFDQFIRPALANFTLSNPEIGFRFSNCADHAALPDLIRRERLDMVLAAIPEEADFPDSRVCATYDVGVFGLRHYAASLSSETPFIMPLAGSSWERRSLKRLAGIGLHPKNIAARSEQIDVAIKLASHGIGVYEATSSFVHSHDREQRLSMLRKIGTVGVRLFLSPTLTEDKKALLNEFVDRALATHAGNPAFASRSNAYSPI